MFCLRKAASRVLSSSTVSLASKSRPITSITPFYSRLQQSRQLVSPLQRRWASEDATQSEPTADRETEAQHGDNSIAASSEAQTSETSADQRSTQAGTAAEEQAPESAAAQEAAEATTAAEGQNASIADTAKSTASAVAAKVSNAASQVGAAASSALGTASGQESAPASTGTDPKTLYVGNLFFDVKEDDLKKEFAKAGNVLSVKIIYDQRGLSKGFGYIDYDTQEGAENAIQMFNMQNFEGRRLTVQHTIPRRKPQGPRGNQPLREPQAPTKTLFIGNMAFDMSDRDLNNLFREIKNVVDVRVAIDRRTGQPRGFAHADFTDVESAEKAMAELADKQVCGRFLRVDYSSSSSVRQG